MSCSALPGCLPCFLPTDPPQSQTGPSDLKGVLSYLSVGVGPLTLFGSGGVLRGWGAVYPAGWKKTPHRRTGEPQVHVQLQGQTDKMLTLSLTQKKPTCTAETPFYAYVIKQRHRGKKCLNRWDKNILRTKKFCSWTENRFVLQKKGRRLSYLGWARLPGSCSWGASGRAGIHSRDRSAAGTSRETVSCDVGEQTGTYLRDRAHVRESMCVGSVLVHGTLILMPSSVSLKGTKGDMLSHLWTDRGYSHPQLRPPSLTAAPPGCLMSCSSAGPLQSGQRWPGWVISSSRWGTSSPCSFCFLQTHLPECLFSTGRKDRRRKYELKDNVLSQGRAQSCLLLQPIDKHIRETLNCVPWGTPKRPDLVAP